MDNDDMNLPIGDAGRRWAQPRLQAESPKAEVNVALIPCDDCGAYRPIACGPCPNCGLFQCAEG